MLSQELQASRELGISLASLKTEAVSLLTVVNLLFMSFVHLIVLARFEWLIELVNLRSSLS